MHQYGDLNGEYGLCCFSIFSNGSHTFGKNESPKKAFNNSFIKQTRLAMLREEKVSACKVCYDWEKEGIESHRQRMNQRFSEYESLYSLTNSDGSVNNPPVYIDFRFGNLCNFTCRMCGSYASSSWSKESKYHGIMKKDEPNFYDHWTDNDTFWEDIDEIKQHIKVIYFAGGEPFVQIGHYKMLEILIDSGCSKNIELSYNTNLSYEGVFKGYDLEQMWTKFKKVELWPSIEGFKERAEYGRKGLDWKLFETNCKKFQKYITSFSMVSNVYSITSNLETIKFIKSIGKSFNITNLVNPVYMSTTVFSSELKKSILENYKNDLSHSYLNLSKYELNLIFDSLRYMNSKDDSIHAPKLKEVTTRSDLYRNESFESLYPELAEWYKNI